VNRWLTMLVVLLALAAGLGAALTWRTHGDRADAATRQERYGAVLAAADSEVTAFVNMRYDRAQQSVDAVAQGATGDFRDHYVRSAAHVIRILERHRSLMSGHVVWSGVSHFVASPGVRFPSLLSARMPARISDELSGVRSSWLMLARNSLLY